jgi:hypothetical protein
VPKNFSVSFKQTVSQNVFGAVEDLQAPFEKANTSAMTKTVNIFMVIKLLLCQK